MRGADAGGVRAVLPAWRGASRVLRGGGVVLSAAGTDRGGAGGHRGLFQRHLRHHVPLLSGVVALCGVPICSRGQRRNQSAPLGVSVQHPAPVPIAVPSSHCGDDESSQRSAVFRAICFGLR